MTIYYINEILLDKKAKEYNILYELPNIIKGLFQTTTILHIF